MNWPTAAARTQAEVPECSQCDRQLILAFCPCLVLDVHSRGLCLYSKEGECPSVVSSLGSLQHFPECSPGS